MPSQDFKTLINKAVSEESFKRELIENPEKVVKDGGYDISEKEAALLKVIGVEDLSMNAEELDVRTTKAAADDADL